MRYVGKQIFTFYKSSEKIVDFSSANYNSVFKLRMVTLFILQG